MSELAATSGNVHFGRQGLFQAARPHARPLVLGCMLAASLLVWLVPATPETRCMLARQAALSGQAMVSLALALTTLAWFFHQPLLNRIRTVARPSSRLP